MSSSSFATPEWIEFTSDMTAPPAFSRQCVSKSVRQYFSLSVSKSVGQSVSQSVSQSVALALILALSLVVF